MAELELIPAFERREDLKPLYEEYAEMLLRTDPVFSDSLAQQNYDEEIERLEEKYAPPRGRIYLVYVDGALAGCVGMKPSDEEHAELKRLYVRPAFRGNNLGERLTRRLACEAEHARPLLAVQRVNLRLGAFGRLAIVARVLRQHVLRHRPLECLLEQPERACDRFR